MDAICRTLPVRHINGWRAPSMQELQTLMVEVPRNNGIARWTELYLANEAIMAPALPPFPYGARLHPRVNLLSRDLYTYEGQPTTLAHVERGKMYHVHWFNRWTQPFISRDRSIRFDPGASQLGNADRLLCVATP